MSVVRVAKGADGVMRVHRQPRFSHTVNTHHRTHAKIDVLSQIKGKSKQQIVTDLVQFYLEHHADERAVVRSVLPKQQSPQWFTYEGGR